MAEMERLQAADGQYLDNGVRIIELSQRARELYLTQPPAEKRKLLGLLLSNCTLEDGRIEATYRQPFDTLALMAAEPLPATGDDDEVVPVSQRWHAPQDSNLLHSDWKSSQRCIALIDPSPCPARPKTFSFKTYAPSGYANERSSEGTKMP